MNAKHIRPLPSTVRKFVVVEPEGSPRLYGGLPGDRLKQQPAPLKRRPPPFKAPIGVSKAERLHAVERAGRAERALATTLSYERRLRRLSEKAKKEPLPEGLKMATDLLTDRIVELCERKLKLKHKSVRKSGRKLVKKLRCTERKADEQFEVAQLQFEQGKCYNAVKSARESKQLYSECGFHLVKNAKWFRVISFIQQIERLQNTNFNAVCIQKTYRGFSARKRTRRIKQRQRSAVHIQRVVRGRLGRKRYKRMKKDVSARKIQCEVRRFQAKKYVHKRMLERDGKDERLAVEIGISGLIGISFTEVIATLEFADGKQILLSEDAQHLSLLPGNDQYGVPIAVLYNVYQGEEAVASGRLKCRKAFLHDTYQSQRIPLVGAKYSRASMDVEIRSCSFEYYKSDPVFRQKGLLSKDFKTLRSGQTRRQVLEENLSEEEEEPLQTEPHEKDTMQVESSTNKKARLLVMGAAGLAKADFMGKRYVVASS